MDLLTVLLHEYGHVLGLDHNPDLHDFMAEELQPGVRRTVSAESMDLIWDRLRAQMSSDPLQPFSRPDLPFGLSMFLGFGFARRRIDAGDTGAQGISLPPLPPDPNAFVVTPSSVVSSSPQFQLATHSDVFNGDFSVANVEFPDFGWRVTGDVSFDSGAAELRGRYPHGTTVLEWDIYGGLPAVKRNLNSRNGARTYIRRRSAAR